MTRIWPPPRWPLIHEARRIGEKEGREALEAWLASLSPEEREEIAREFVDLLRSAFEVLIDRRKGKP